MDKQGLREEIKKKFGSIANFCRVAGLTKYELDKKFDGSISMSEYKKLHDTVMSKQPLPSVMQMESNKIERLRATIADLGGVDVFCVKNPQFSRATVYEILRGRRKLASKTVKALFEHFKLE